MPQRPLCTLTPTCGGYWISVRAPLSNSSFTPSTSPAFTARNRACMGTWHRLGSAPLRSSKVMVSQQFLRLWVPELQSHRMEGMCRVVATPMTWTGSSSTQEMRGADHIETLHPGIESSLKIPNVGPSKSLVPTLGDSEA